ncbi:Hypothetical predicted protein [Paramuricea clavata]|uniref:Uncharacterized protein n=1 Tax=Paramuricea clavata TaxID=317549 RepID=A0A7D9E4H7_PARCT|nr:Hypothetical predicted protein [Paramuricea clavata]
MVERVVLIWSGLWLSGLRGFTAACSIGNEYNGVNEICTTTSLCECKSGFIRNGNGTCIVGEDDGTSSSLYTALVAVFSTLIVVVLLSICIFLLLRWKKVKCLFCIQPREDGNERLQMTNLKHKPSIRQILGEYNQLDKAGGSWTQEDFERLIQSLREDAHVFLQMINEVKRKLNMLDDKNTTRGMQYKALIRDISRVLRLLNRKPAKLEMPVDGVPLLLWAENALKRFENNDLQNPRIEYSTNEIGETSENMRIRDAAV